MALIALLMQSAQIRHEERLKIIDGLWNLQPLTVEDHVAALHNISATLQRTEKEKWRKGEIEAYQAALAHTRTRVSEWQALLNDLGDVLREARPAAGRVDRSESQADSSKDHQAREYKTAAQVGGVLVLLAQLYDKMAKLSGTGKNGDGKRSKELYVLAEWIGRSDEASCAGKKATNRDHPQTMEQVFADLASLGRRYGGETVVLTSIALDNVVRQELQRSTPSDPPSAQGDPAQADKDATEATRRKVTEDRIRFALQQKPLRRYLRSELVRWIHDLLKSKEGFAVSSPYEWPHALTSPAAQEPAVARAHPLHKWLDDFGLEHNPFHYYPFQAGEYSGGGAVYLEPDGFEEIAANGHVLVAGKHVQDCWAAAQKLVSSYQFAQQGLRNQLFPVWWTDEIDFDANNPQETYRLAAARSMAKTWLLLLTKHPELAYTLSPAGANHLFELLCWYAGSPSAVVSWLQYVEYMDSVEAYKREPSESAEKQPFARGLQRAIRKWAASDISQGAQLALKWPAWLELRPPLVEHSVHIVALNEPHAGTNAGSSLLTNRLQGLMEMLPEYQKNGVDLKLLAVAQPDSGPLWTACYNMGLGVVHLQWSKQKLGSMLDGRVMDASHNSMKFADLLDPAEPDKDNLCELILDVAAGSPTRMLQICERIVRVHIQSRPDDSALTRIDVEGALRSIGS